jgi:hypothetical protein
MPQRNDGRATHYLAVSHGLPPFSTKWSSLPFSGGHELLVQQNFSGSSEAISQQDLSTTYPRLNAQKCQGRGPNEWWVASGAGKLPGNMARGGGGGSSLARLLVQERSSRVRPNAGSKSSKSPFLSRSHVQVQPGRQSRQQSRRQWKAFMYHHGEDPLSRQMIFAATQLDCAHYRLGKVNPRQQTSRRHSRLRSSPPNVAGAGGVTSSTLPIPVACRSKQSAQALPV